MTTAAQDELNGLFDSNRRPAQRHPDDDAAPSTLSSAHSDDDASSAELRSLRSGRPPPSEDHTDAVEKAGQNSMRVRYFLPGKQHEANTGPKGVIADAYAFESARKAAKRRSFLPVFSSTSFTPPAPPPQYRRDEEKAASSDDDDEDAFMRRWREARLKEIQMSFEGGKLGRGSSPTGRKWGSLVTVDAEGYLDAVEKSPKGVTVVVLVYDDDSAVSNTIESLVMTLAKVHKSIRFVRLHFEEAEFEAAGVPAILAYRNGEKFAGLVPAIDELPEQADVSAQTLEKVLERHNII